MKNNGQRHYYQYKMKWENWYSEKWWRRLIEKWLTDEEIDNKTIQFINSRRNIEKWKQEWEDNKETLSLRYTRRKSFLNARGFGKTLEDLLSTAKGIKPISELEKRVWELYNHPLPPYCSTRTSYIIDNIPTLTRKKMYRILARMRWLAKTGKISSEGEFIL